MNTMATSSRLAVSSAPTQKMDSLIPAFFGQTDSQCISTLHSLDATDQYQHEMECDDDHNALDHLDGDQAHYAMDRMDGVDGHYHSILEVDNELVLTQIPGSNSSNGLHDEVRGVNGVEMHIDSK